MRGLLRESNLQIRKLGLRAARGLSYGTKVEDMLFLGGEDQGPLTTFLTDSNILGTSRASVSRSANLG